jgi:arylsulfatase A-like enzyme
MMEVFAGYGAHADHEINRVLDAVAKLPDADNTMVIYIVGDNGASAEGGIEGSTNENAFFNYVPETWQDNGWGFYIQGGRLVGLHNYVALERYRIVSAEPLSTGKITLAMGFKYDGGGTAKGGPLPSP